MKKLILAFVLLLVLVIPAASLAGHVSKQADYSLSRYKFSGITHTEAGNPSCLGTCTSGLQMMMNYWSFTDFSSHTNIAYGLSNWDTTNSTGYGAPGMQVGLAVGYDPWGNVLVSNYPLGTWTEANHPNDGHLAGAQTYVPNAGQWRIIKYAEVTPPVASVYKFQSLAIVGLQTAITVQLRHDAVNQFSMVDGNGAVIGILNHLTVPQYVSKPGYRLDAWQESFSPNDDWLDFGVYVLKNFFNPSGLYWQGYTGCSGNGYNGDVPADPTCHGGAATSGAPLDIWRQTNPNWAQVQLYCQECETATPPFAVVRDPETLPPASDSAGTKINGVPKAKQKNHAATSWNNHPAALQVAPR